MATLTIEQKGIIKSVRTIMRAEDKVEKAEGEVSTRYTEAATLLVKEADKALEGAAQIKQLRKEFIATLTLAKIAHGSKMEGGKRGTNLIAEMTRRITVLLHPETDFMRTLKRPHSNTSVDTPMVASACETVGDFQDAAKQVNENLNIGKTKTPPKPKKNGAVKTTSEQVEIVANILNMGKEVEEAICRMMQGRGITIYKARKVKAKDVSAPPMVLPTDIAALNKQAG